MAENTLHRFWVKYINIDFCMSKITSIQSASENDHSSVTVADIQPLSGNRRRGLVMKMNEAALEHVSISKKLYSYLFIRI